MDLYLGGIEQLEMAFLAQLLVTDCWSCSTVARSSC